MNLSYLKYAVEVEKTGSITKAAQNFYMNQPHLSKIIRELERDLGCDIFDRTSRGMVPTKKGEEFLQLCKGNPGAGGADRGPVRKEQRKSTGGESVRSQSHLYFLCLL